MAWSVPRPKRPRMAHDACNEFYIKPNDHVEGFITPTDEKRARVGWIATRIHREEKMVDALRLSTLRPRIWAVVS